MRSSRYMIVVVLISVLVMSSVAGGMADFEDIHEEGMGSDLDEGLELSIESRYPEKEMRDN